MSDTPNPRRATPMEVVAWTIFIVTLIPLVLGLLGRGEVADGLRLIGQTLAVPAFIVGALLTGVRQLHNERAGVSP